MAGLRARIGGRVAVLLVGVAALVSIVTGITRIVAPPRNRLPFVALLPEEATVLAGFTGAITGFLLLVAAYGLRQRLRAGWYAALVLLPLTALQGLVGSTTIGLLLALVSVVAMLALALDRAPFSEEIDLTPTQWAAIAGLIGALGYSTAGAYALNDQFTNLDSITDAVYFSIVTASTVGYGDVTPTSALAKWFAMSALVVNVAAFAVALGVLFTPMIEARLTTALGRMTDSDIDLLADHVLVLGYGELTEPLIDELLEAGVPFLVVTPEEARARMLNERDGVRVFTADPSDEKPLERANVTRARAVVAATNNDAEDALAILTARQLNPDVTIVAAATERENMNKLKRAGADTVISPATIGGHLLVESALGGEDSEVVARRLLDETDDDDDSAT
ncbi:NAD-binding protein [Halobaculum gomorrense]|uniref:Voltage-gated potassium channel n=1 Tax=Halobaculum gomorrense TaxID=43928 RepID=A0A1M5TMZ4_9EURY|nr:NAD-binding protein [Halobaculum gomorrense]SHH52074.1 voltage-gated potassium channel [Halobaculum gomorrense]